MRSLAVLAVAAMSVWPLYAARQAPPEYSLPIRIGVVAFDNYDKAKDPASEKKALNALGDDRPVAQYLHALAKAAKEARPGAPAPRFQIYRGNYYQVMAWIENGDVDGALLSPFMAMRATEVPRPEGSKDSTAPPTDRSDTAIVATFAYTPEASQRGWSSAYICAVKDHADLPAPNVRYKDFVQQLVASARAGHDETANLPYVVNLVSHLSTSGFIVPLMETHRLLHAELQDAKEPVDRDVVAVHFWNLFFRYVRFTFWHQKSQKLEAALAGKTVFEFTYETSPSRSKGAIGYLTDREGIDPNDVLVLRARPGTATYDTIVYLQNNASVHAKAAEDAMKAIDDDVAAMKQEHDAAGRAAGRTTPFEAPHWYRKITLYNDRTQEKFETYVHNLFLTGREGDACAAPLHARWGSWYQSGQYDFSADEVITLLSHDQMIRNFEVDAKPAGALVLPGGGVRGTYQAALLDKLYDRGQLVNFHDAEQQKLAPDDGTMILRHIIGTSGGALVGFFAAQRSAGEAVDKGRLLRQWIDSGRVVATPDRIFPPVGLLRWISALVILGLYTTVARMTFGRRDSKELPSGPLAPIVVFGIGVPIFLAPFVLWRLARVDGSYTPTLEGSFYCIIVLAGHAIFTVTRCPGRHSPRRWRRDLIALFVAVLAFVALFVVFFFPGSLPDLTKVTPLGVSGESLFGFAALLAIFVAVLVYARDRELIERPAVEAYGRGVCVAAAVIVLAWGFFKLGTYLEATSTIEMTIEYWIWIGASAIAAGAILTGIAVIVSEKSRIYDAVVFWTEEHKDRRFLTTPGQSLVSLGVAALVLWVVFAAPALYTSSYGFDTFRESARNYRKNHKFLTNFVATTTSLGTVKLPTSQAEFRGGYYVCREEPECGVLHSARPTQVFQYPANDPKEEFLDAVFASGSPFPIYPSRRLRIPPQDAGMFMDGGYTHNTPIEAAHLLNAQQVLIVNSGQRADTVHGAQVGRTVSALAGDSATLFSFLFDRSQALDQAVRANMFVASLAPYGGHRPDAFLMDFRESTVRGLAAAATDDLDNHRIGQVDSWGLPTRLLDDSVMNLR